MSRRDADHAGRNPPIMPMAAAKTSPMAMALDPTRNWNEISLKVEKLPTAVVMPLRGRASSTPATPPRRARKTDSSVKERRIMPRVNPSARSVPISFERRAMAAYMVLVAAKALPMAMITATEKPTICSGSPAAGHSGVVRFFRNDGGAQALIVFDFRGKGGEGCGRIGADEQRTAAAGTVEITGELIQVHPDFVVERRFGGLKDAHHIPEPAAKADLLADAGIGITLGNRFADDRLPPTGLKHDAVGDFQIAHGHADGQDSADRDIHALGVLDAGEIHDGENFGGDQRFAGGGLGDAGEMADDVDGIAGEGGDEFGSGGLAENEHLAGIAAGGKKLLEACGEGECGDQHGDGQANAQGGHQRGAFALHQVAEVVIDRHAHKIFLERVFLPGKAQGFDDVFA